MPAPSTVVRRPDPGVSEYVSTSYAQVKITYADGAVESTGILNMIAMGGPSTWRMTIGSDPKTASHLRPPAKP
jgi:hypothetical protein